VSGDLDALTAPAFRHTLELAARQSNGLLVVDMHDLRFMDSAGLAALVGVHRQLSPERSLALGNVPARMQRMLRVAAMSAVLPVHEEGDPWPWPDAVRLDE
jgi:anti-sigma B factor antagonist